MIAVNEGGHHAKGHASASNHPRRNERSRTNKLTHKLTEPFKRNTAISEP